METQENLSLKNIFKTLSSKDAKAIEELQDKLRFLAPKLSVSIQARHFKNVLESFYQQNKESLGFFPLILACVLKPLASLMKAR